MWRCSKIKPTLNLPKNTWDQNNKQTKEASSWNHSQLVLSTMHTVKTVKIVVVVCVFFVGVVVVFCFFFSCKDQTKRHDVWEQFFSDFRVFVDHCELYKIKSASRHQDQSSTLLSEHFRDLLSTSSSFPERLVQSGAVWDLSPWTGKAPEELLNGQRGEALDDETDKHCATP